MGDSSCAGRPGGGASATVRIHRTAGRAAGRTGVQHQGHRGRDGPVHMGRAFSEGPGDGKAGRPEETELVVRRHRMMEKGRGRRKFWKWDQGVFRKRSQKHHVM